MSVRRRALGTAVYGLVISLCLGSGFAWAIEDVKVETLKETPWWNQVQESIGQREYEVTWQQAVPGETALQATNRAQNLRAHFRTSGVRVVPRAREASWLWGFEMTGFGRHGSLVPVELAELRARGSRIEYLHPGVTEWYENCKEGIEQGFVISERPEGEGPLLLVGRLSGSLQARLSGSGDYIMFVSEGREVLRYAKLEVEDAEGRALSSRLALEGDVVTIVIDEEGIYPIYVDPLLASPSWIAEGDQTGGGFGYSVASAGDVNGDGYSDVIVGAYRYDNGEEGEGIAYVYHGSASGLSATPAWTAESDQPGAHFGISVACAGDVNGDGYSDVIVGASGCSNGQPNEGRAYVYHGSASGLSATPAWTAESDQESASFGNSVASAGDVNGDGYSDVIVGAYLYTNGQTHEGRAYVYHGSASGISGTRPWVAEIDQAHARFGNSVASAGDVNGDGYSDVIVGAYLWDERSQDEGVAYVYHGGASGLSGTPAWGRGGGRGQVWLGCSVASAGDVNGDGYSDVIVGANGYNDKKADVGCTYVFHGSASGISGPPAWTARGDQAYAYSGNSVASAGDVNGDGYSDVIVGAHRYDNGQTNEGRAYVYHGSASGLSGTPNWTAEGDQDDAWFGESVASAGDVNGDGYSDVIVGVVGYGNGKTGVGAAYAYYSSPGATPGGTDVVVEPVDPTTGTSPVTFTFDEVTEAGVTSLTTSGAGQPPPLGFRLGNPPVYYELTTTAAFDGSVEICIDYSSVSFGNESNLKLYHRENGTWVDRTVSLDSDADIICADVSSFSSFSIFEQGLAASVDVDPNTLNLKSTGNYATCYIELPEGHDPLDIDMGTVLFEGVLPAELSPTTVGDYDSDGVPDRMVKFNRSAIIALLSDSDGSHLWLEERGTGGAPLKHGAEFEVTVIGDLTDGNWFYGADVIRVINPGGGSDGSAVLEVFPSPLNSAALVSYEIAGEGPVGLRVYDAAGRLVRTLVSGRRGAGRYEISWDRKADDGRRVAAGVYFIRLDQQGQSRVERVMVVE